MFDSYTYEDVGEFVKALGHEKRLQIIELLSSHERCVEELATAMDTGIKSVSAHLKVMRLQGLVVTRKEGLRVYYRLRNNEILELYQHLWQVARAEKKVTSTSKIQHLSLTLKELLAVVNDKHTLLIDVRDTELFNEGHIPKAISVPIDHFVTWAESYHESHHMIVVYCEGYYCIQAFEATNILLAKGLNVKMYQNGLDEWTASGFDIER